MSQPCPFCVLVSELPQNGDMLQAQIITQREKYEPMTINVHRWMRLIKDEQYPTPHEFSDEADTAIGHLMRCHFPPKKREEKYAMTCPHAPFATYIKYVYYVVGEKSTHLLGDNEFLMRMWLDKPSPPSVDGSNATGTQ